MDYITLTKDDPEFESYLLGTFSTTHRALPVETYHVQTARERVTFQILPVEKIAVPPWWQVYFWSCRPELLALTLGPSVAAWLNHRYSFEQWTRWPSWFALAGIFFVHTGVFLLNDVQDHLRGADRMNRRRGSQVIQKGWVTAQAMRRWAWVNLGLAVAFGVPAFFNAPVQLLLVCLAALAAIVCVSKNFGTRAGLADLALLALFGPLLTCGIGLASFGETNAYDAALGFALGATTLWVFQVRQFQELFRSRPEHFHTFLAFLDFDRAKRFGVWFGYLLLGLHPLVGLALRVPLLMLGLLPLFSLPLILALHRFQGAASPLSSNLVGFARRALLAHLALAIWWVLALGVNWL